MSEAAAVSGDDAQNYTSGVRLVALNLPEDEGEGLGFRLTRTLWDPYPWVHEVIACGRAAAAGLKPGDCILQVDGKDLLGVPRYYVFEFESRLSARGPRSRRGAAAPPLTDGAPQVGQVAAWVRGDGGPRGVSLLVWNCGVDPQDDPDLLWSCGGGARGERARRALSGVLRALACCVCAATATKALSCARSHVYCDGCWRRLQRCALCREPLPARDSPYARNLVAEQVFEAIAAEYDIKDPGKKQTYVKSNAALNMPSPSSDHRLQRQISLLQKSRKTVQFGDRYGQNYASDPNLSKTLVNNRELNVKREIGENGEAAGENDISGNIESDRCQTEATKCACQSEKSESAGNISHIKSEKGKNLGVFQHKLVSRLRPASSLADLQKASCLNCGISRSMNSVNIKDQSNFPQGGSLSNLAAHLGNTPVFLMTSPPVYLLACDHDTRS
ncbi:hypothetical protein EVAR_30425_1 [Eumeta japonica]|uniref:PDZ domain-containing protein n=1 Tax=Eumeta variegata TaxID=151549 RepID=A0A4C1W803_EUMVA|nr:hypothetical protein EVAR_30425_1 [Eumeta japonica]